MEEGYELATSTTVDCITFYDEYGGVADPSFFLERQFSFWSIAGVDVYLSDNIQVFQTTETDENKMKIINAVRVGFLPFEIVNEEYVYGTPVIYAYQDATTVVTQDPNYTDPVTVYNLTTLGVQGGTRLFSIPENGETSVYIKIWLEGNDPEANALIAESSFSVNLSFMGVQPA